eukprot:TRINITY_DN3032_c0_g1_i1.p1 TRINITY_DN3032_c0_g1~~TRINITY_DN3032_c0_g1_i1.p1  ORF type:complete len:225 (-),score=38.32 TRINITY_DN3032_c0_g1_i1:367-1041(-)
MSVYVRWQSVPLDEAVPRLRANDPTLTHLHIKRKGIGDEGAVRLADALGGNTALEGLYLALNNIGDEGASRLADCLRHSTALKILMLHGNTIGDEGAGMLADALRGNTALNVLNLELNQIGDKGTRRFTDALQGNTVLVSLKLHDGVHQSLPRQLGDIIHRNCRLKRDAVKQRKMVFAWCATMDGNLPLEIIEKVVRQSAWDVRLSPRELHLFLNAEERLTLTT